MNLNIFLISSTATLKEALSAIELNHYGIILTTDSTNCVNGLVTDGDIRRKLIQGCNLDDPISKCSNPDFIWADILTPREVLLKQLDHKIKAIPILDNHKKLKGIVSRDHLPILPEGKTYARARSPVRISFGGGGSDLTHFFADDAGAVINTTVSLYSHATLKKRDDSKIIIHSSDLNDVLIADNLKDTIALKGKFGLIQALLRTVNPDFGFELFIHSDFPMGSGLGGSAALASAVLGCFNQFRQDKWDSHEIAELAFQSERLYLGISGGWQDQYATVFGGFNFMEFRMDQNVVHPLRIPQDVLLELEESLILCDTGISHISGEIHKDQKIHMQNEEIRKKVQSNVELTYKIRNHLLRGRLYEFGLSLNEAWILKKQFSNKISNNSLDKIYEGAIEKGALGGKLLGAGAGGFFLFYAPAFKKHLVVEYLVSLGLKISPFRFEPQGLRAWSIRESKNGLSAEVL